MAINHLKSLPISVSVRVCGRSIKLDQLLNWSPGTVLEFEQTATSPLQLKVGNRLIAIGRAVKINGRFGIRVRRLVDRNCSPVPLPETAESKPVTIRPN